MKPEVILLDEPCSALDPISTVKIEELIAELTDDYTIVIVTHNMQQAARVSDFTAFMYLGDLIEFDGTSKIFTPRTITDGRLHHRPLRMTTMTDLNPTELTIPPRPSTPISQEITRRVAEMGGLAERPIADAARALAERDTDLAERVIAIDPPSTPCSTKSRTRRS